MISAEKVNILGKAWIKITFKPTDNIIASMRKVPRALYNPKTKNWAVPYEEKDSFEKIMGNHLIVWDGDLSANSGGINEDTISPTPSVPGYSVEYDSEGNIIKWTGFKTKPYPFQVKGFNLIVEKSFLLLADDMGLGKTWQVTTAMEALKKQGKVQRGVVVCKASLLYNWRDEIQKHTDCKSVIVTGTIDGKGKIFDGLVHSDDWTFIIISFETYRRFYSLINLLDNYKSIDFLIVDEAAKIKNSQSRIGDVIHHFPYPRKYLLTATPIPNTPLEAFNYLTLGHKVSMNWWAFKARYAEFGGHNNKEIIGYKNIIELRKLIQDNMLRRLKKDKLKDLPEVTFSTITVDMNSEQLKLYNAVRNDILKDLEDTDLEEVPKMLAKLIRLQQITDSPALIGGKVDSAKLTATDELLEELIVEGGNKVILFSRFKTMVDIFTERYKKYNPSIIHGGIDSSGKSRSSAEKELVRLYGNKWGGLSQAEQSSLIDDETTSERQNQVYKFQQDNSSRLFIGSSSACREGLTLTAATYVVFYDLEWNWDYMEQAYSRCHRIGQKNAVTVYFLVCKDTIDEKVLDVIHKKKNITNAILNGNYENVAGITGKEFIQNMV